MRSAGQRPTGLQLGLQVCLLQCRVGVGLCTCCSASVAFCHFQNILALGKLSPPHLAPPPPPPPQPVLESVSVTRVQIPGSLLLSVVPLGTAPLPSIGLACDDASLHPSKPLYSSPVTPGYTPILLTCRHWAYRSH